MKKYFWQIVTLSVLTVSCGKQDVKLQKVQVDTRHEVHSLTFGRSDSVRYPLNVILMIGDGMGLAQIYAAMTANKGNLHLQRCRYVGLSKTNSADDYITDSAAGATAFACGKKTKNGAIAVDTVGKAMPTLLEMAIKEGMSTGLVATCAITHATPASFIAHQPSRKMYEEIAADFLKTPIDVFIGGGSKYFKNRKDNRDLTAELAQKGYKVVFSEQELASLTSGKIAALLADEHIPALGEGRNPNWLQNATQKAMEVLSQNPEGFFLMVEGSQIDWGGHANDARYVIEETLDFDRTIGAVLDFADKTGNTLVIITADHETGGLTLNGGSLQSGEVVVAFTSHDHTAIPVPVFAYGVGAENFAGFYENTAIFTKIAALLGLE